MTAHVSTPAPCWCGRAPDLHCRALRRLTSREFSHAVDMPCHERRIDGRRYCRDCEREIGENPPFHSPHGIPNA